MYISITVKQLPDPVLSLKLMQSCHAAAILIFQRHRNHTHTHTHIHIHTVGRLLVSYHQFVTFTQIANILQLLNNEELHISCCSRPTCCNNTYIHTYAGIYIYSTVAPSKYLFAILPLFIYNFPVLCFHHFCHFLLQN